MTEEIYRWTPTAIYCYNRGCRCTGCYIKDILESSKCRLKKTVIQLVTMFGKPQDINESQHKVLESILKGANTKKEIAETANLTETNVQTCLSQLFCLAEADGVSYQNKRYKLPEFIEWLRKVKL